MVFDESGSPTARVKRSETNFVNEVNHFHERSESFS